MHYIKYLSLLSLTLTPRETMTIRQIGAPPPICALSTIGELGIGLVAYLIDHFYG